MKSKSINCIVIFISIIALIVNYSASDGNIETYSKLEMLSSNIGLLLFVINTLRNLIFLVLRLIFWKQIKHKDFCSNFLLMIIHIVISSYFILNSLGRLYF